MPPRSIPNCSARAPRLRPKHSPAKPDAIAIHVHPDDASVIEGFMPFAVVADPSMQRGSIRAEADDSWAADGIQEALARVQAELGQ